jgi:hypothetical protein
VKVQLTHTTVIGGTVKVKLTHKGCRTGEGINGSHDCYKRTGEDTVDSQDCYRRTGEGTVESGSAVSSSVLR